jgi:hypothetical protein
MTGVQLIGKKAVVERFTKTGSDTWALYQGKQFIVGGVGGDVLEEWLTDFEATESTATYTLRVYDSDQAPTSSTGNADYIACLNFKVVDQYEGYGIAGHNNKLMQRIKGLEDKLEGKDKDDDKEGSDIGDIIMGWFENPEKLGMVAGAIRQLMGGSMPMQPVGALPAPLQTIAGLDPKNESEMEDSLTRISKALDILEKHDKQLVVHLEKLAKLASTDPITFTFIISKLDAL